MSRISAGLASKWLLTLTNLVALWPILSCRLYPADAVLLGIACCCSLVHHAAEQRFYEPSLVTQVSPRCRRWLLKADQAGALVAILGLGSLALLQEHTLLVAAGLACMLLSEAVMFIPPAFMALDKAIMGRTTLHCAWHLLSLGWTAWLAVTVYAHEERLYQTALAALRES
jgi:hypothetical protein